MKEMTALQQRKRRARYGGRRMLLDSTRGTPEAGVGALGVYSRCSWKISNTKKNRNTGINYDIRQQTTTITL